MKYYVGIDLGGTNVRVAKIDENGTIVQDLVKPSHGLEGPKELVRDTIFSMLDEIEDLDKCEGIGMGVPGAVDPIKRVMTISSNINGFENYPMAQLIEDKYKLPCFVDNDANVAGLAEALLGSGKGQKIVYYITHSTGIGGALIINGQVISGRLGYAGEVANIIIDRNREQINKLNAGAVESEASGTAIIRKSKKIFNDITSAREVFDLCKKENPDALKIIDDMSRDFAQMLATIAHVVDPNCFVIGGGVTKSADLYMPKVKEYFQSMVHVNMRDIPINIASLKEPGVLGAALLAKSSLNSK